MSGFKYEEVKTTNDEWSGFYLTDRIGTYFEILLNRRAGGMGLCLSSGFPFYSDVEKILDERSDLNWQTGQRDSADGRPWYNWYSTDDYLNITDTLFNTWIMKYHLRHFDFNRRPYRSTIDSFEALTLKVNPCLRDKITQNTEWIPGEKFFTEKEVMLKIPRLDEVEFVVTLTFDETVVGFEFETLKMSLFDKSFMSSEEIRRNDHFELKREGDNLIFKPTLFRKNI